MCVCVCASAGVTDNDSCPQTWEVTAVSPPKKSKQSRYELSKDQKSLIKADTVNSKLWEELLASVKEEVTVRLTCLVVGYCDTCVGTFV